MIYGQVNLYWHFTHFYIHFLLIQLTGSYNYHETIFVQAPLPSNAHKPLAPHVFHTLPLKSTSLDSSLTFFILRSLDASRHPSLISSDLEPLNAHWLWSSHIVFEKFKLGNFHLDFDIIYEVELMDKSNLNISLNIKKEEIVSTINP